MLAPRGCGANGMKPLFRQFERVHLIGIGGAGMEGLARILQAMGCQVSGSDQAASRAVEQLRQEGIRVHVGHGAAQVRGSELVVYSAAVPADNEELREAGRLGIPAISRAEILGELTRPYWTVGVAGSHGKTTTAAMLAIILQRAGCEPSALIGGWLGGRVAAWLGQGGIFVVEADEFQRSFLHLRPQAAVVTTIDAEHLDCYRDLAEVEEAFCQYLERLPFYGCSALGGDDPGVQRVRARLERPSLTYGLAEGNDARAEELERHAWGSRFAVVFRRERLGQVALRVPGLHNIRNALGAAALAHWLGVEFAAIEAGLGEFKGVGRRFERKGEISGVLVVDDYAHHPTEIAATLEAARETGRRVVAVFQPHLYSRTRVFIREFARALQAADQVFLTAIYGSREAAQPGVDAGLIARAMSEAGFAQVEYIPAKEEIPGRLLESCRPGDLVLTIGAGDVGQVAEELVVLLQRRRDAGHG